MWDQRNRGEGEILWNLSEFSNVIDMIEYIYHNIKKFQCQRVDREYIR